MERVLGKRAVSAGVLYIGAFIFIVAFDAVAIANSSGDMFYIYLFVFPPLALIDLLFCISYLRTPKESIILCPDGRSLFLAKYDETVLLRDIERVQVFAAESASQGSFTKYKWGEVYIEVNEKLFKIKFVSDCECVADEIEKMVEMAKREYEAPWTETEYL